MSMMRRSRLAAVAAVSAALTVSALSLAPSSPASAASATATATYTCANPLLSALPAPLNQLGAGITVPATISLDNLPEVVTDNVPIPAGTPFTEALQFPTTSGGLAGVLTGVSVAVDSLLGTTPLSAVSSSFSNGVATINGQLGAFTPSDGLPVPLSFNANLLTSNPLLNLLGVTCTYDPGSLAYPTTTGGSGSGGSFGGLPVGKQKSKIKAHQIGKKPMLLVKVKNQTGKASGKVVATLHGKKVGKGRLHHGKLRMKLKRLGHGLNKVKLAYQGDAVTLAGHKNVRVKLLGR